MTREELEQLGITDEQLAREASSTLGYEVELRSGDEDTPLRQIQRANLFREVSDARRKDWYDATQAGLPPISSFAIDDPETHFKGKIPK